ncbi:MAG: hypothetical protein WD750_05770 [Gammaproteobacteria bacterium]
MDMKQFSFQGHVLLAERDANGNAKAFRDIGVAPTFDLSLGVNKDQQYESQSGRRRLRSEIITGQDVNLSLVLNDFSTLNLGLALYGTPAAIAAGSVTDEALPSGLEDGDLVALQQQNISNLVLEDNAAAALTEDTHYEIQSAEHGTIKFLDLSTFTQPLVADYDYAGGINIAMFAGQPPIRWVRLQGINTADGDKPVLVELYKVKFDPVETLSLINEAHGQLSMNAVAFDDDTKAGNDTLGRTGRIIDLSQPQS